MPRLHNAAALVMYAAVRGARPVRLGEQWAVESPALSICGQPGETLGDVLQQWCEQSEILTGR